jgi:hypothetical protein
MNRFNIMFERNNTMQEEIHAPATLTGFMMTVVVVYNLALLAGVSYLVYWHDASAWLYALALLFGASWPNRETK